MLRVFWRDLVSDLKQITWWQAGVIVLLLFSMYGMLVTNPTMTHDFNAAKGDPIQVFLTYFFMHRLASAVSAAALYRFSPIWNASVGFAALCTAALFMMVLFRRLGYGKWQSVVLSMLCWATPFFYSISIYQYAFHGTAIALAVDALALLGFEVWLRRPSISSLFYFMIFMVVVALSFYQAHAGFLLTAMMGICMLKSIWEERNIIGDIIKISLVLGVSVIVWGVFNYGPMLLAKCIGINIPPSGGAHDAVYWFSGSFVENLFSLIAGFAVNWIYTALFVIGLRWVLAAFAFCFVLAAWFAYRRRGRVVFFILAFVLSVFSFPILQGSCGTTRIMFGFVSLIAMSGALALRLCGQKGKRVNVVLLVLSFAILSMGHETATLYYYNWKTKGQDGMHMSFIARDLWGMFGLKIKKPVAVVGGFKHYPTGWDDLRPFNKLPLLHRPFTTYSNINSANVPREFYMLAREKIGLVVKMPELDVYQKLIGDKLLVKSIPAYPRPGYIQEREDLIVVNLGPGDDQWEHFNYADFASPNEKLLAEYVHLSDFDKMMYSITSPFRRLAERYPWALVVDPNQVKQRIKEGDADDPD